MYLIVFLVIFVILNTFACKPDSEIDRFLTDPCLNLGHRTLQSLLTLARTPDNLYLALLTTAAYFTDMNMILCINCGIATDRCNTIRRRLLEDDAVLSIVREWVAPQTVNENDFMCQSCWNCANSVSLDGNRPEEPPLGYCRVCTLCGRSLLRRIRCHQLKAVSVKDCRVLEVVKEWVLPQTVSVSSILCHSCWVRATKTSRYFHLGPSTSAAYSMAINEPYPDESVNIPKCQHAPVQVSQPVPNKPYVHKSSNIPESQSPSEQEPQPAPREESQLVSRLELSTARNVPRASTIVLPAYFRPFETESRCFVEGCRRRERNRITLSMRKQLLNMYNYYVPPNNRLCDFHLTCTSWDFLNDITDNIINTFTANQIQDMMLINKSRYRKYGRPWVFSDQGAFGTFVPLVLRYRN